jgi:hypothetical protein
VAAGATGIQVKGDYNTVLIAGEAQLHSERRHRRRAVPRDLRDLLLTELRATNLVGRQEELAALRSWRRNGKGATSRCTA